MTPIIRGLDLTIAKLPGLETHSPMSLSVLSVSIGVKPLYGATRSEQRFQLFGDDFSGLLARRTVDIVVGDEANGVRTDRANQDTLLF
jgi:hypothetical protein